MVCDPNTCDKKCQDHGTMASEIKHLTKNVIKLDEDIKDDIEELKDYNKANSDVKGRVQVLETRAAHTGTLVGTAILVLIALFSGLFASQMSLQDKLEKITAKVYELLLENKGDKR